jgi:hypothetical protein
VKAVGDGLSDEELNTVELGGNAALLERLGAGKDQPIPFKYGTPAAVAYAA